MPVHDCTTDAKVMIVMIAKIIIMETPSRSSKRAHFLEGVNMSFPGIHPFASGM